MSAGDIQRANLDGSNVEVILEGGIRGPESIALDIAAGKMYWTDWNGDTGKIQRSDLDGSNSETLVLGLNRPGEIALDLVAGKMYYTDTSFTSLRFSDNFFSARIMRADLDGSNAETVLSIMELVDDVSFPFWDILPPYQDIALDLSSGKMYWAGGSGIGRANLAAPMSNHTVRRIQIRGRKHRHRCRRRKNVLDGVGAKRKDVGL